MTAVELGPLDQEPRNIRPPFAVRRPLEDDLRSGWRERRHVDQVAAIRDALTGVELGAYDERMIEWLAGWDTPTIGAIVSLLYRARQAGASS